MTPIIEIRGYEPVIRLYGVNYALEMFRGLSVLPVGTVFQIIKREDGVLTLEKLEQKK